MAGKPPIYKAGWWLTYPSEKWWTSSVGAIIYSQHMESHNPFHGSSQHQPEMAVCQNLVPLVNIKIAGKWMFIPLKMYLYIYIGIDPYPNDVPWIFPCSKPHFLRAKLPGPDAQVAPWFDSWPVHVAGSGGGWRNLHVAMSWKDNH